MLGMKLQFVPSFIFEWDQEKNDHNIRKHGVSFELALRVFYDEYRIEKYDEKHSDYEDRYISIGLVDNVIVVVHTDRDEAIRIISARPANKREVEAYYEQYY